LERDKSQAGELTRAARQENQKWHGQFNHEHECRVAFVYPLGKVMRVPANPRGQGLRFEMIIERRQMAPGRIVARQFHAAGAEHQFEQQPAQEPQGHARGLLRGGGIAFGPPLQRRKKDGEKPGFQKEHVPLKTEKGITHRA
jgi:hypothetical protein